MVGSDLPLHLLRSGLLRDKVSLEILQPQHHHLVPPQLVDSDPPKLPLLMGSDLLQPQHNLVQQHQQHLAPQLHSVLLLPVVLEILQPNPLETPQLRLQQEALEEERRNHLAVGAAALGPQRLLQWE